MKNIKGYEPDQFVDDASEEYTHPSTRLIQLQRAEWQALFEWCAKR